MGYQTDFIGYLQIDPPLGRRERSFINRISGSPFLQESGGSLRVADEDDEVLRGLLIGSPGLVQLDGVPARLLSEL